MRSEGTVVGSVCLSVCYSTSHFSNVCSSHKRYDLFNGQRRSENSNDAPLHCTANSLRKTRMRIIYIRLRGGKRPFCFPWFSSSVSASKSHFEGYNEPNNKQ